MNFPWPPKEGIIGLTKTHMYAWMPLGGFGDPNYDITATGYYALVLLFMLLTRSIHYAQSLFLYANYVGIIGGMYFLCRTLGFDRKSSLFAGLFYMLTPFVATGMPLEVIGIRVLPFYLFLPITTAVLIQTLRSARNIKGWCVFGIVTFLATISNSSLQYFVLQSLTHLFIIFFLPLRVIKKPYKLSSLGSSLLKYGCIIFLCNIYWLISIFISLSAAYQYRMEIGFSDVAMFKGAGFTLLDGFRFLPYPHIKNMLWGNFYYKPLITFIALLFSFLGAAALLSKRTLRTSIPFALLLVTALFLGKGRHFPLGFLNKIIFLSSPYITRLFRNLGYFEAIVVFATAILVASSLHQANLILHRHLLGKWATLFLLIPILFLLSIYGIPFFSGSFVKLKFPSQVDMSVSVPAYYCLIFG